LSWSSRSPALPHPSNDVAVGPLGVPGIDPHTTTPVVPWLFGMASTTWPGRRPFPAAHRVLEVEELHVGGQPTVFSRKARFEPGVENMSGGVGYGWFGHSTDVTGLVVHAPGTESTGRPLGGHRFGGHQLLGEKDRANRMGSPPDEASTQRKALHVTRDVGTPCRVEEGTPPPGRPHRLGNNAQRATSSITTSGSAPSS